MKYRRTIMHRPIAKKYSMGNEQACSDDCSPSYNLQMIVRKIYDMRVNSLRCSRLELSSTVERLLEHESEEEASSAVQSTVSCAASSSSSGRVCISSCYCSSLKRIESVDFRWREYSIRIISVLQLDKTVSWSRVWLVIFLSGIQ